MWHSLFEHKKYANIRYIMSTSYIQSTVFLCQGEEQDGLIKMYL